LEPALGLAAMAHEAVMNAPRMISPRIFFILSPFSGADG
jgi:hypothetical protein